MRWFRRLGLLVLIASISGCSTLGYYQQALSGHLGIMGQRQSISRLLTDPNTPVALHQQLEKVNALTAFAEKQLALPARGAYRSYANIGRRYVVWNVFASPELSLQAKSWCYPFAGCASYRGFYSEHGARQYAQKLKSQGLDVYVAGITAYSTLGWFNDPVLSTFIHRADARLANLIFHELAHQKLYMKGDTQFNESFATVVAREGVRRWFAFQQNQADYPHFLENEAKQSQFVELVLGYRIQLDRLYQAPFSDARKRLEKKRILQALREAHQQLKNQWGGQSDYDTWFAADLNNAQLNTVATYFELVPELETLLSGNRFDLPAFYQASKAFALEREKARQMP